MNPLHLLWIIPVTFVLGELGGVFLVFLWGMIVAAGHSERLKGQ